MFRKLGLTLIIFMLQKALLTFYTKSKYDNIINIIQIKPVLAPCFIQAVLRQSSYKYVY